MNFKTTIALLILLAAVGVWLIVQHFTGAGTPAEAPAIDTKLITAAPDAVTRVSITPADGKRIVLTKTGSDWRLVEPLKAPADKLTVDELIRQLTSLQSRAQLPAGQKSALGLDSPRFVVEIEADGKTSKLAVGDENKVGDSLYVLLNDESGPRVVGTALYDQLDKPADTYRSKKLTELASEQAEQVRQLAITHDGKTVRLVKRGLNWQITAPRPMPADSSAVSNLVFAITDLNASDFVAQAATPASYGLTSPETSVWYSTAEPTTRPAATEPAGTTIRFGRFESLDHKNVYVQVNDGPIATVAATNVDSFAKTDLDLRDKKVVDIDPARVESFTLAANSVSTTRPAQSVEYSIARRHESAVLGPTLPASRPTTRAATEPSTKPTSKWVFSHDEKEPADDAQVDALLSALHPLQADKFMENSATTQPTETYTLTIHAGPGAGQGPRDYVLHILSPGPTGAAWGKYEDVTFETDRALLDKLDVNFKGGK